MKENKYDSDSFFDSYSRFPRSVAGLSAAGEWQELEKLLPDFEGKRVLDIGCGFGWHCRYAAEHGAARVTGLDLSEKMLSRALEMTDDPRIEYMRAAMEDMAFEPCSFDVIVSSLVFHYTPDFDDICRKAWRFLAPGGTFVFSAEHPVFTAQGPQEWACGENGSRLHWPVDRYFESGARSAVFLGEAVTKYHRTITEYISALLASGFVLSALVEPRPAAHLMGVPGMADELRRPMMLLIKATKPL